MIIVFMSIVILYLVIMWIQNLEAKNIKNMFKDDWAIYNYGQTIDGNKGVKGVDINILNLWKIGLPKESIIVAVIDTGIDKDTYNLNINIDRNKNDPINGIDDDHNGYIDDYFGWNFYDGNNQIFEKDLYDYHGTYLATTISKVNPEVRILSVKFLKSTIGSSDDAVEAIKYAINRGAKIINCSWNFTEYNQKLYDVIKENPDILFICSAGNKNINIDRELLYPCSYDLDNILNVLAIDNKGRIYEASGYGKQIIDIGAPGKNAKVIISGNEETYIDGTSVAAAFVTGAVSIIKGDNPSLSPIEIIKIINVNVTKSKELKSYCKSGGFLNIENSVK